MNRIEEIVDQTQSSDWERLLKNRDEALVRKILSRPRKDARDLALLLSPAADNTLEEIARYAHRVTVKRFGRVMQLYAPLYISNFCVGGCPYCGFRSDRSAQRRRLTIEEVLQEGGLLTQSGMRHILLVSGEDPKGASVAFLAEAVTKLKQIAPSVSIEVPPLKEADYKTLATAGVDGVTLYQETYDPIRYAACHPSGPKSDYTYRLTALDRAGRAGIPKLTLGALWGLGPWRLEALRLGLHAMALERHYWRSHIALGMPRLKQVPNDFSIPYPMDDRSLVHVIAALRAFLPDAGLVLSTREPPALRDKLVPLGITQVSAGSKTEPGGYAAPGAATDQFEVSDHRTPAEVADRLQRLGYDPVWKDWEPTFGGMAP
ncbi:MAG: 2-iminoacetate synthase ThiH [Myxococcota bacterium]|nr:2-iminoacetate synthase ThiH [Myxococcota bacterium]